MKNPLNQRQYLPYALNTPSGNFDITEGVDFFNIILRESLTGNFSVTGSLQVNGEYVYSPNTTNTITIEGRSHMFGGINNTVTGIDNVIVGSSSSTTDGQNNTIVGGRSNDISGDYSVGMGSYINILHTGAMVLKDGTFSVGEDNGDDSLSIYFTGGIFVDNQLNLNNQLWVTGGDAFVSGYNLTASEDINVGGSGMLSGDLQVLGTPYHTGSKLQNLQNFRDNSGIMSEHLKLASGILRTGVTHLNELAVLQTGNHQITGKVEFCENFFAQSGEMLMGTTGNFVTNSNHLTMLTDQTGLAGYSVEMASTAGIKLIVDEQDGGSSLAHTGDSYFSRNGLSVWEDANLLFGVGPSGHAYFANPILIEPSAGVPATATDYGHAGQIAVDGTYIYLCTADNVWKRVATSTW